MQSVVISVLSQYSPPVISLGVGIHNVNVFFVKVHVHYVGRITNFALSEWVRKTVSWEGLTAFVFSHVVVHVTSLTLCGWFVNHAVCFRWGDLGASDGSRSISHEMVFQTLRTILVRVIVFAIFNFLGHVDSDTLTTGDVVAGCTKSASVVMFQVKAIF